MAVKMPTYCMQLPIFVMAVTLYIHTIYCVQNWPEPYIHTVHDRMCGDSPAKNTIYAPYIPINVCFWPT